ncbi:MAG: Uma2 family endonuclease [Cyanobacteria bacterium J06621_11]
MVLSVPAPATKTHSAEEYLALETQSDIRNEFRNGEIVPIAGGTPAHNKISSAFNALLWISLRKKPFSVFVTDQRLWIPDVGMYTYPDVMVVKEPIALQAGRKDTVINPILIAETLSDSTQTYDRGDKFAHYRTIDTFQEYVLIEQHRPRIEHYIKKSDTQWLLTEYAGLGNSFKLQSVGIEIELSDLYEDIDFNGQKDD